MLRELQNFGLTEKEAQVYLASLEMGNATADQLAKQANVKRPTTYLQIESLIKKGLMSTYEESKKTYFAPESPDHLKKIFKKEKQKFEASEKELNMLLPDLSQMFAGAGERPVVRFFDGKEGVVAMREHMLTTRNKEFLTVYSQDTLNKIFTKEERGVYSNKRIKAGIKSKLIYTRSKGKLPKEESMWSLTESKYVSIERLSIRTDIVIFDTDQVAFTALEGKLFGTIIQSKEIADSMRAIFNFLWNTLDY